MFKALAKLLLGERQPGELGYYQRLRTVENNLKRLALRCVLSIVGIVVAVFMMVFLFLHGGDDQCTFTECNCGINGYYKSYHCVQHGHECMEND